MKLLLFSDRDASSLGTVELRFVGKERETGRAVLHGSSQPRSQGFFLQGGREKGKALERSWVHHSMSTALKLTREVW